MNKTSTPPGQLLILRGLPGSGKSTFARKWVNESPSNRVRVNRDDLRMMTFDRKVNLTKKEEESITALEHSLVVSSLSRGLNVVVDAMHLRPRYVTNWYKVASSLGTTASVHTFEMSLEELFVRNQNRPFVDAIPTDVLSDMFKRQTQKGHLLSVDSYDTFLKNQKGKDAILAEVIPAKEFDAFSSFHKRTVVFDVDGTLMLNLHGRGWYDYDKVHLDTPNYPVRDLACILQNLGVEIVVVSGRSDECREATYTSLRKAGLSNFDLLMRKAGDNRQDDIVKYEIFDKYLRHKNIWFWVDDRPQVIRMVEKLGIPILNVGKIGVEF